MLRRRRPLPTALHDAWWAFVACTEVIEGGRRQLLATLPAGRVDPAPVEVGVDAVARAIEEARAGMWRWRLPELADVWSQCHDALDDAAEALPIVHRVAATANELEDLLDAVHAVIEPLAVFGDAERAWRRHWRLPTGRSSRVDDTS